MSDIGLELEYQRVEPQCATCGRYLGFEEFELYGDYCTKCMERANNRLRQQRRGKIEEEE